MNKNETVSLESIVKIIDDLKDQVTELETRIEFLESKIEQP